MAVYTDVSDKDLADLARAYDMGDLLSCKGIAEGVENSNFLLRTTTASFILTLYEKRVDSKDLPFFLGLMEHLAGRGIPCPTPVKTRAGDTLTTIAGRPAALITFLDGVSVKLAGPRHCLGLGETLAKMHLAARDFAGVRKNTLSVGDWRGVFERARDGAETVRPGLTRDIGSELDRLEKDWPAGLPQGVIHADLFPDNVFFLNDRLSGIIDFYFACQDAFAYDIAICLNAWCFERDGSFNITKARALLSAYETVRRLEDAEYEALPLLARGAAMRFFVTRLYDWLNTPPGALVKPKDPLEYVRRLQFHRDVKTSREYGLDR